MGNDQAPAEEIVSLAIEDAVGIVTLGAPALSRSAKEQLLAGLRRLSGDSAVRAVVLADHYHPIVAALTAMPKPVIAAINGSCAGAGILLGEPFTARQALEWGLVGRLVEPGSVLSEARELASRLAAGPTQAYAEAKRAIQAAALPDVLAAEHAAQSRLGQTADHKGAVQAFLAKQRPAFCGR